MKIHGTLMKHQEKSVRFMKSRDRVFDMSDPGTGKTLVEMMDLLRGTGKTLILGPRSLLQSAWGDDFDKFLPEMPYTVAYADNRDAAFKSDAKVFITNVDAVSWLASQKAAFFKGFERLIVDESTAFANHDALRSKKLDKIKKYFEVRRLMSGTVTGNHILKVWNQANILDDGKRLGPSYYHFRSSVTVPNQTGKGAGMLEWSEKPGAAEAIGELLKDITIRHKFDECIDIPPNTQRYIQYRLPKKLRKQYEEMYEDAILELQSGDITAVNAAVKAGKLLQIASGAVYDGQGGYALLDTGRYELVADLVEERQHSVTFFHWAHQRNELERIFKARKIHYACWDGTTSDSERTRIKRDFQAGFYQTLLGNAKSMGHGQTFTRGTATIWASPTYDYELWDQGGHRVYRATQTQKTENIVVVAHGTLDLTAYERCLTRGKSTTNFLSYFEHR